MLFRYTSVEVLAASRVGTNPLSLPGVGDGAVWTAYEPGKSYRCAAGAYPAGLDLRGPAAAIPEV
jgi:hypothetical protein